MAFNPTYAGVGDNKLDVYGATDVAIWTITMGGADTYLTGGLALTAALFGLSRPILAVEVIAMNTTAQSGGMVWQWNFTTQSLMAVWSGAAAGALPQVTNGTSIANFVLYVKVTVQR